VQQFRGSARPTCQWQPDLAGEHNRPLCGLTMDYHAYKLSLKGDPKIIDGFTDDQRFFLSFAQMWRESDMKEFLGAQELIDPHSPRRFRVNCIVFNVP
jgi:putative endopeptidase